MKILFIGCVESSYILLKRLLEMGANIVGIITKKQSEFNADFVDLAPLCTQYNKKYIYIDNINDDNSIKFLEKCEPDVGFCFGWSQLIKENFLSRIPRGVIGFHPAKLPYNKGRHPVIWALVLGLEKTASTFFEIDLQADNGDIISQREIIITYEDNARTLYDKIMKQAEEQIVEIWRDLENNSITREKQDEGGNVWRKRGIADGCIDWRMSSRSIYNLVRGLTKPYVGAHFILNGKQIKVWKVQEIISNKYMNIEPGKILDIYANGSVDIKTGDYIIRIIESDVFDVKIGDYL